MSPALEKRRSDECDIAAVRLVSVKVTLVYLTAQNRRDIVIILFLFVTAFLICFVKIVQRGK